MPDVNDSTTPPKQENTASDPPPNTAEPLPQSTDINANSVPSPEEVATDVESKDETDEIVEPVKGIKITEDIRYKKYFKMMQMGVPAAAVKIKMQIEGFDGDLLEWVHQSEYLEFWQSFNGFSNLISVIRIEYWRMVLDRMNEILGSYLFWQIFYSCIPTIDEFYI